MMDRAAADAAGTFGQSVAGLKPDIVIDMICFDPAAGRQLVEALRGKVRHFLSCGTIWVHGYPVTAPITEDLPRCPVGEYGIKKAQLEAYLLEEPKFAVSRQPRCCPVTSWDRAGCHSTLWARGAWTFTENLRGEKNW